MRQILGLVCFLTLVAIAPAFAGGLINSGETKVGAVGAPSYSDTWEINCTAGDRLIVNAVTTSGSLNTQIRLYPGGGGPVEADSGAFDTLDHRVVLTGMYTIVIGDWVPDQPGEYSLSVLRIPGAVSYAGDPDGGPIASGETRAATVHAVSDIDAFQISCTAGDRLLVNAVKTSGSLNTQILFYPPDSGGFEADSGPFDSLDCQVAQTGVYTIVIQDWVPSATGNYSISVLKIPGSVGYAGDADGGHIASGETRAGTVNDLSDMDAFQINCTAGDRLVVNAVKTYGSLDTQILLYPPNSGPFEADTGPSDTLDCQVLQTGVYTLVIQDWVPSAVGEYTLSVLRIPGTVTSSGDMDGGPVVSGDARTGTINTTSDMDAFQISCKAGDQLMVSAVTTSGTLNTQLLAYPPDGAALEAYSGLSDTLEFAVAKTGLYTIVVQDWQPSAVGAYSFTITKNPSTLYGIYNMSPADGSTFPNGRRRFEWDAAGLPTGFDVYTSAAGGPEIKVANNIAVDYFDPGVLDIGKRYDWRVVGHYGAEGDFASPTFWFTCVNAPPANLSITPSGGTLTTSPVTLSTVYSDPNGFADVRRGYLLINDSLGQSNACLLWYERATNRLYLKNDANSSWGTGYAPGTDVTLSNSQCFLYVKDTTVSGSGDNLAVNWRIGLKSAFTAKNLNAYMNVLDTGGLADGWDLLGRYYNVIPQIVSIDPEDEVLPIGAKTTLTSVYRDLNGFGDLRKCYLLVNDSLTQTNAIFLWYDRSSNKLYLKNDANTSWGVGYTLGANVTLSNSHCEVYVKDTTASGSGSDLTVIWSLKLKSSMTGKNLYSWMYVTDSKAAYDGWKKVGTHFTPVAPVCVSVTPSTGKVQTGIPLVFTTEYSDDNGNADIWQCYFQMGQSGSLAGSVCVLYDAKQGKVFLRNDANTSWGTGQAPGTAVTLENTQCIVYVGDVTVTPSGSNNLIINWNINLKPVLIGKLLGERAYCRDNEYMSSNWKLKGYVRAQ